jgi:hypothetical protein
MYRQVYGTCFLVPITLLGNIKPTLSLLERNVNQHPAETEATVIIQQIYLSKASTACTISGANEQCLIAVKTMLGMHAAKHA